MENPFANPLYLPLSQGGLTVNRENPLVKGGNEGDFEARRSELSPVVRAYADRLYARVQDIYKKYGVVDSASLLAKASSGDWPRNNKPSEFFADVKELSKLQDKIEFMLGHHELPEGDDKEFEVKKEKLYVNEGLVLSNFFNRLIEVPPLPVEITLEKMKEWEKKGLELHYLPPIDLSEKTHLEHWKRPNLNGFDSSELPSDAMLLPGCWVLSDGRPKPHYENPDTMYKDDEEFLGPVIEKLVKAGLINKWGLNPKSRYFVSLHDLRKPEIMADLAQAYGMKPGEVAVQRMIEFNVLGNLHHPEWGESPSDSAEWFDEDVLGRGYEVSGGNCRSGGLSSISRVYSGDNVDGVAFRLVGHFK